MLWIFLLVLLVPTLATAWIARVHRPKGAEWKPYLTRVGILFGLGLFAAGPFLTTRSLGTSEAYNYSLAVADTVSQFRAGEFPALVGQSEFAFNGRIHPLRTAPYLTYFAGLLDLLSFRQLNFWALQNLALALSLLAASFTAYWGLRRAAAASSNTATTLAAVYVLSPGLLGAAYAMDLYMTVMAAPFIPLVIAANLRALDRAAGARATYILLAASLAACWWAHPPVAMWLSLATAVCHVAALLAGRLRFCEFRALLTWGTLGVILAGFVFVSALTVRNYDSMAAARAPEAIVKEVVQAFPASLRPISAAVNTLGDFQMGYALWGLWTAALVLGVFRRNFSSLVLVGCAGLLLAYTTPVPGLTSVLWERMPTFAMTMNGPWPMQRLYLIVAAITVFAFARAGAVPRLQAVPKAARDLLVLALAALFLWTVYQGFRFVGRGYASRADDAYTRYSHYTENINPTLIAYAMFPLPPHFSNGVMDPSMEIRLLKRQTAAELLSNWSASAGGGTEVQKGTFTASTTSSGEIAELTPRLKLEPGRKYRLELTFRAPPINGVLRLIGANTLRVYPLPQAGQPCGFGMLPGNNPVITLWTSAKETEIVTVQLIGPGLGSARLLNFADFVLREIEPDKLPVRVKSWAPFVAEVDSPEPGYLEIPRVYLRGYAAEVNGQPVRAQASPDRLVMAAVPAGRSLVTIAHPGPAVLRAAFWASVAAWGGLGVGLLATFLRGREAPALISPPWQRLAAHKWKLAATILVLGVCAYGWHTWKTYANSAGALRLKVVLPRGEIGRSQPLLTTGEPGKGAFVFAIYTDATHVQLGIDIWGQGLGRISDPVEIDYFGEHEIVISTGTLYPTLHPKTRQVDPERLEELRNRVTLQLNGKTVLDEKAFTFDAPPSRQTIGLNRIGGSSTEPRFVGEILEVERLPVK